MQPITSRARFLDAIAQLQSDTETQRGCAPITLQIGHVSDDGQIRHDTVLITDAPPIVWDVLKNVEMGNKTITPKGVLVTFRRY